MFDRLRVLVSVQDIREQLKKVSSRDHTAYDAFILVILSHGKQDGVYGIDGDLKTESGFVLLDDITSLFDGANCPSLMGKPKMFFIQACQGGEAIKDMQLVIF